MKGDESVGTGPAFEWIDEDGQWHASDAYPLKQVGVLEGDGSGQLPLTPASSPGSGVAVFASPSPISVTAPIEAPQEPVHVLGAPQLRLVYSGTASPEDTFVYAQIVDRSRNIVVNNLATPIPVALDGEQHELTLPLERIASRSTQAGYELQIVPGTSVYDIQRSAGFVDISEAHVELPVSEPVRGGDGPDCSSPRKGTSGKDRIDGTEGPDAIAGGSGRDRLKGRAGGDCLAGQRGGDRLGGGGGEDLLKGGKGTDRMSGGTSGDELRARGGGRDRVRCGPGHDSAKVDRGDRVRGCERVQRKG